MKIYTKTGDKGETGLFGGSRISKSHTRLHAYGSVDELNCVLGLALSYDQAKPVQNHIELVQNELFQLGAELATEDPAKLKMKLISEDSILRLESEIDAMEKELPALKNFVLPSGSSASVTLQLARTVCRRAERWVVELSAQAPLRQEVVKYLNRLSDALFVMARFVNFKDRKTETIWKS